MPSTTRLANLSFSGDNYESPVDSLKPLHSGQKPAGMTEKWNKIWWYPGYSHYL